MKKYFCFLSVLLLGTSAFGQGSVAGGSLQSMLTSGAGAAGNIAMAAIYRSQCSTDNKTACAMAGMHAGQAGLALTTMFGSGQSKGDATNVDPFTGEPFNSDFNFDDDFGNNLPNDVCLETFESSACQDRMSDNGFSKKDIISAIESERAARNAGFDIDVGDGEVTGPDGKKTSISDFAASAMGSGAFDPNFVKEANKAGKAAAEKKIAALSKAGLGGGGGGGKRRRAAASAGADPGFDFKFNSKGLLDRLRAKGSVNGMTRSLAGESIGVAGDNIFEMLSRRYQAKDRANHFLP